MVFRRVRVRVRVRVPVRVRLAVNQAIDLLIFGFGGKI